MHSPATYSTNNLIRLTPAQCSLDRGRTSNSSGNGDIGSSSSSRRRSNSSIIEPITCFHSDAGVVVSETFF